MRRDLYIFQTSSPSAIYTCNADQKLILLLSTPSNILVHLIAKMEKNPSKYTSQMPVSYGTEIESNARK